MLTQTGSQLTTAQYHKVLVIYFCYLIWLTPTRTLNLENVVRSKVCSAELHIVFGAIAHSSSSGASTSKVVMILFGPQTQSRRESYFHLSYQQENGLQGGTVAR